MKVMFCLGESKYSVIYAIKSYYIEAKYYETGKFY